MVSDKHNLRPRRENKWADGKKKKQFSLEIQLCIKKFAAAAAATAAKSLQLFPTLCDPMDHSPPSSFVHGISQARILEWVVMLFSRGSSRLRIKPTSLMSPALAGRFFTTSTTWKANKEVYLLVKNEQKKKNHKIVFGILENLENISGIVG